MKDLKSYINEAKIELVVKEVSWNGFEFKDYFNKGINSHRKYTVSELSKQLKGLEGMPKFKALNYDYEVDNSTFSPSDCARIWVHVLQKDFQQAKEALDKAYVEDKRIPRYFDIVTKDKDVATFMFNNSK